MTREEGYRRGMRLALRYLAARRRSVNEVRLYLSRKELIFETIEDIIQQLLEWGYLNDLEFGRAWVKDRLAFNPRGYRLLQMELLAKGLDREVVREALERELPPEKELEAARALVQKQLRIRDLRDEKEKRRIWEMLQRRGFSAGVLTRIAGEIQAGDKSR